MSELFGVECLEELTSCVADALASALDRDWTRRAGGLDWSCAKTADHTVDAVLAPAFFLASRKLDAYPDGGWSPGEDASPSQFVEAIQMAARMLGAVVAGTDPGARAIIWRRPHVATRGPEDFVPRGALELILHAHDICSGLDVTFAPPAALCEKLRQHTESWPHWHQAGWSPLRMTGDPWVDLLHSSGRAPRR